MKSLQNERDRLEVLRRLERLVPDARPGWGRLTAPRMICHVADALRVALGERSMPPPASRRFTRFPLKHLFLYVIPMPRNLPTSRVLLSTAPGDFESDRRACADLVRRFSSSPSSGEGPGHQVLGVLTWRQWGVLQWRHLDHHLRQFGV
jgi:hypothetical protein